MDDLISRRAAIDALEREKTYCTAYKDGYTQTDYFKQYNMGLTDGIKALNKLPSAQRKGRIIIRSNMLDGEDCYCSECDHWALLPDYKFCPYCGVAFEDVISEIEDIRETMEEFMYGQDMGNPEDGSL